MVNQLKLIVAWWLSMLTDIMVNSGKNNGLTPIRQQSIIYTHADLLSDTPIIYANHFFISNSQVSLK